MKISSLQSSQRIFILVFLVPIFGLFLIFWFVPIIVGAYLSLLNYNPLSGKLPFVGLAQYRELLTDELFIRSVGNTFQFSLSALLLNIFLATAIAIGLHGIRNRSVRDLLRTFYFLPVIAPIAAVSIVFRTMLDPKNGIFNTIYSWFGTERMIYLLQNERRVLPTIVVVTLICDLGYNIVIIMAGLQAIPKVLYEAADIDGASRGLLLRRITLPLLSRTLLFVLVMTSISYFTMFTQVHVLTSPKGGPNNASRVIALSIYEHAFRYWDISYASAMSIFLLVVVLAVTILQFRFTSTDWEY